MNAIEQCSLHVSQRATFSERTAKWCEIADEALQKAAEHEDTARAMRKIARSCLRKALNLIEQRLRTCRG